MRLSCFFKIKGQKNNECDSKFNTLKQGMHGINIYTEDGLDKSYKKNSDHINLNRIKSNITRWKAFTKGLSALYRNPTTPTTMKNHIFLFGANNNRKKYTHDNFIAMQMQIHMI